jgi:hypothetical protein
MKKNFIAIIACIAVSYAANGSGVYLKAGVSKGAIRGAEMDSFISFNAYPVFSNSRVAPLFDIGYEQSFGKIISAYSGVGLRMLGNEYHAEFLLQNGQPVNEPKLDVDLYFTYLSIPLKIKFLLPMKFGGFFIDGGPQFSFLVSNETKGWYNGGSFNMELGFGVGSEINIGKHNLILESGYDFGLTEICKINGESEKMGTLTILSVGFRFNTLKAK